MKRILVYGMTNNPGGIETYLMNILRSLDKDRITFDFVTDFPEIVYKEEILSYNSKVFYIPPKGKKLFKHWTKLWRILREHPEYRIVYFNILDAGAAVTMLIPWMLKRRIIVHSHNGSTDKLRLHNYCRPLLNLFADKFVACSQLAASFMFGDNKKDEVLIVPNAIDIEQYKFNQHKRIRTRNLLNISGQFVVCHIGRISEQKNPYGLLKIFKEVLVRKPDSLLLYIGSGELEKEIHEYAVNIGIKDKIYFMGKRKDIPELLCASDVFLLPSFYEGLPIVGIEAQASALPCILSDTISKEIDITGDVIFCSLNKSPGEWANVILNCQNAKRISNINKLQERGYSLKEHSETYYKLLQFFDT
ncbi:glycosyltransferase family 1 protein [Lactonifactor longoviformis]|uniref:glycosyltransferase family 1 protein n=1 Tax=Lactonifactor TaxID=420345 RepID=UPI0012AF2D38|nr:glycosyltransferase family 1 protein [Lactonifactor longoviformis]MRZ99959.1 glycosyltransferase [Lactonifactor sp. BIOML-A5]MSA07204.1 glycosyltransferase [Lactonifactor sp. BIOML-A4]MSA11323.1 glycosyltransferase [Lactonifactor sp. BIOML-A3]MSA15531.1 glycosyltransferase [Lactonifactor sp. BIOML-A2]MSA36137.1 glycosyltransferase [Lactonifactor sp. BIOML-A1]MSB12273.1 glycosyltransferase [Lactonifactor sp. BIOML-A6]MSB68254.1 glycosyltransferase [Lactonifactor sp. BIOML-A7]